MAPRLRISSPGTPTSSASDVGVGRQQLRQPVDAVDPDGPLPAQVVEPDVLQLDALGRRRRTARRCAAGGRWPRCTGRSRGGPSSSSAWVTMPTGLVKSTIHASGAPRRAVHLGEVEHDGHRPQRLGEAARPGRLLADDAEASGQRLVDQPGRLAADAQLDEHEVGAVERRVAIVGQRSAGRSSRAGRASAGPARRRSRAARRRCRAGPARRSAAGRARRRCRRRAPGCRCCRRRPRRS